MNVVIIDDDQLVALSLQTILEACDDIQVSATGGSGADAIRLYEEYQPDVRMKYSSLNRFKTISYIRKSSGSDNAHGIIYI